MSQGPIIRDAKNVPLGLIQIRVGKSLPHIGKTLPVLTAQDSIGGLASTKLQNATEFHKIVSGFPQVEAGVIPLKEDFGIECAFREFSPKNFALAKGLDPFSDIDAGVSVHGVHTTAGTTSGSLSVNNNGGVLNEEWTVTFTSATTFKVFGKTTGFAGEASNLTTAFSPTDGSAHNRFTIPADFFAGTWAEDDTFTFFTTAFEAGNDAYSTPYVGEIGFGNMAAPKYLRVEGLYIFPDQEHAIHIILPRAQVTSSVDASFSATDEANVPMTFGGKTASSDVAGGHIAWDDKPLGIMRFA
jgi:hypothetical protein